jgi:4-alpha-glucanotransferase
MGFRAPFAPGYRTSGILLHVTSLPSRHGIGDVGPSAFAWVDQLAAAGQSWWQVLPLGPTGYGHSPYQALSSFAANSLVLSPDRLIEDGLLKPQDCEGHSFPIDHVDFERVIPFKEGLLFRAWDNFRRGSGGDLRPAFEQFCEETAGLQSDPALFMALRRKYGRAPFQEWPSAVAGRERKALAQATRELANEIEQFRFGQFLLLRHWKILKQYANDRGVRLLGDLPIFVSPDSADVWANPELFLLDEQAKARVVAGVPPDYFSAQGQLWGNPVYDWEVLRRTRYRWWIDRLQSRLEYLDAIRIDHFRGFEAAWHVPVDAPTAATGHWVPGPGAHFFERVREAMGGLPLLAEDLGLITPAVTALRDQFELPGMRVLQFAFNGDMNNPHLPHHAVHNGVIYTGTHDNNTTRGWYDESSEPERRRLWDYLQRGPGQPPEAAWELIQLAWSSGAALAIAPFQDLLGLGADARMNIPGRADGQWRWRCSDEALNDSAWERLHELTRVSSRLADPAQTTFARLDEPVGSPSECSQSVSRTITESQ